MDNVTSAYRSLEPALAMRLAALDASPVDVDTLRLVYERRVARAAAGAVATAAGIFLFGIVAVSFFDHGVRFFGVPNGDSDGGATLLLIAAWPLALGAYIIARVWAQRRSEVLARRLEPTGNAALDLARLESSSPARVLARHADGVERASIALPLIGMAALLPLTLHYVVWCVICAWTGRALDAGGFDQWIASSVAIVGHAHLVVAFFAYRFAKKAHEMPTAELRKNNAGWGSALVFAVIAACVPGAALFLVPPILVAITGLPTIPTMFLGMRNRVVRERKMLAASS